MYVCMYVCFNLMYVLNILEIKPTEIYNYVPDSREFQFYQQLLR